jgi:hypothetical protein
MTQWDPHTPVLSQIHCNGNPHHIVAKETIIHGDCQYWRALYFVYNAINMRLRCLSDWNIAGFSNSLQHTVDFRVHLVIGKTQENILPKLFRVRIGLRLELSTTGLRSG